MPPRNVIASAPGKVLIIGGYLVVEAPNVGISIGVDARFETEISVSSLESDADLTPLLSSSAYKDCFAIRARSPQFKKSFTFFIKADDKSGKLSIFQDPSFEGSKNPFLAHALLYTLAFVCTPNAIAYDEDSDDDTPSQKLKKIFSKKTNDDDNDDDKNEVKERILNVTVRGANDFYSQQNFLKENNLPINTASLRKVPPFADLIGEVSKTGLGSSAALTTSVVGALFNFARFKVFPHGSKMLDAMEENEGIHRIAQSAHCVAQGKVGSGFDVYTACFGTCAYTRFPASTIEPLMQDKKKDEDQEQEQAQSSLPNQINVTLNTLKSVVGSYREQEADADFVAKKPHTWVPSAVIPSRRTFNGTNGLPKNFKLVLGDVHAGGSETPGMVSKIFAWRKTLDNNDPENLWNHLARSNIHAIESLFTLDELQKANPKSYSKIVSEIVSKLPGNDDSKWENKQNNFCESDEEKQILNQFNVVRKAFRDCRVSLRSVGEKADVEVEPKKLTGLLDSTIGSCNGVIATGCPGAGGYDAVFAIVVEEESEKSKSGSGCDQVEKFWEAYQGEGLKVCPLLVRESAGGLKL